MATLTVGCDTYSACAALVTLPVLATAMKMRKWRMVTGRPPFPRHSAARAPGQDDSKKAKNYIKL